jgi:hypothetical protein
MVHPSMSKKMMSVLFVFTLQLFRIFFDIGKLGVSYYASRFLLRKLV